MKNGPRLGPWAGPMGLGPVCDPGTFWARAWDDGLGPGVGPGPILGPGLAGPMGSGPILGPGPVWDPGPVNFVFYETFDFFLVRRRTLISRCYDDS